MPWAIKQKTLKKSFLKKPVFLSGYTVMAFSTRNQARDFLKEQKNSSYYQQNTKVVRVKVTVDEY